MIPTRSATALARNRSCLLYTSGKDLDDNRPRQTEFNKLNLSYTLMSKRNLLTLVKEKLVDGWDDPRMPTICAFRRRGYSPESIRKLSLIHI